MRHSGCAAMVVGALWGLPLLAEAQDRPDPASAARMRIGPVALTPTMTTSIGVDNNVFNEADNPKDDVVASVRPQAEAWLRLGRARLSGLTSVEFVYFNKYDSERSVNTANRALLELPLNRIRPYATASLTNTRARLNAEVDARARYSQTSIGGGAEVRLGSKSFIGLETQQTRFAFGEGVTFNESELRDVLNRDTERYTLSLRQQLTPLTTLVLLTQRQRESFIFSPQRDSRSVEVIPGFEFDNSALLNGRALVGFRRFEPDDPQIPSYSGLVAAVDLGYTLRGATRFQARVSRDVAYSVEVIYPYFVLTDVSGAVTHRLTDSWELLGIASQQRLAYRSTQPSPLIPGPSTSPALQVSDRTDTFFNWGAGVGYRLGRYTRVGLNAEYYRRRSVFDGRTFSSLRLNSSLTYGF
ncbi:MAG: outer membrane beta-barrel protein [Acidobacteria bacterium]|nr:outer membrane beta-barrel protein [Acidobacteriota bacterium]